MNHLTFETHNDTHVDINMSSFRGYVETTYEQLEAAFGKPHEGDEYKVDWEWDIEFDCGTVATVYNWKNGPNYCGSHGLNRHQVKEWHVGGFGWEAVECVLSTLKANGHAFNVNL